MCVYIYIYIYTHIHSIFNYTYDGKNLGARLAETPARVGSRCLPKRSAASCALTPGSGFPARDFPPLPVWQPPGIQPGTPWIQRPAAPPTKPRRRSPCAASDFATSRTPRAWRRQREHVVCNSVLAWYKVAVARGESDSERNSTSTGGTDSECKRPQYK